MSDNIQLLCLGLLGIGIYWLAMSIGQSMGERYIKRKILWRIWEYQDKTVKEMFDEVLSLTSEDWAEAEKKNEHLQK